MAAVSLTFPADPGHVRTARLVAGAVARRAGLSEERVDEIRLVVGELCARAVGRTLAGGSVGAVRLEIDDDPSAFAVAVTDRASAPAGDPVGPRAAGADEAAAEEVALALVRALADEVTVLPGPGGPGGAIRVGWDGP
jgi:anti-sigma regulatory factor (Ser/Thr protein kinase)